MVKLVIFKFLNGSFEQGFPVILKIGEDGNQNFTESSGNLPPAPEIPQHYQHWQDVYLHLGFSLGLPFRLEAPAIQVTNYSISDCANAAQLLRRSLNSWLRSESFIALREKLLISLKHDDEIRVFFQAQDAQIQRLPWHLCDLFEYFPKAEIALIPAESIGAKPASSHKPKVKILAIFGSSHGIDIQADQMLLKQLPNAEVTFLTNPQRQQLNDHLWEQNWSILFFAGHSSSYDNREGKFYINDTEYLSIKDLRYALTRAMKNGLKLAIFNSCDGLGLAQALADLHIPQVIVMREPVPDQVAQAFLKYFLQAFAKGEPFYLAVRQARERLQGLEGQFPCATWLPIIYQNPTEKSLSWQDLYSQQLFRKLFLATLGITALIMILIWWVNRPQNRISSGEKILVTSVRNSDKEAGANAFASKNFELAINKFEKSLQKDINDPETLIYLNNAKVYNNKNNNFKIVVSVPIGTNLNVAEEILRGVAQAQDEVNRSGGINGTLLQVEVANDDNNPQIVQKLAEEFVKDQSTLAVIGHNASDASVSAAEIYQGRLVMISPTSFAKTLSELGGNYTHDNYIFRTVPNVNFLVQTLSEYAIKKIHKNRVAICADFGAVDNQSFRNEFTSAIHSQGGKLVDIDCDLSASDFNANAKISQAINKGADSLLLAPHVDRINKAIEVAKGNQGQLILLGSPTLYTSQTLELGQADVNGLVLAVPWSFTANPGNIFPEQAVKLWGGPVNWRTAMSYDATQAIISGLKQSDRTRAGLQKVLSADWFSVKGATGTVQFLPSGDRNGEGILVQVQPSTPPGTYHFVPLKP